MVDRVKLIEKREAAKLSQAAVANKLNISASTYYRKEAGDVSFKEEELFALAGLLKLSRQEVIDIFFVSEPDTYCVIDDSRYFDVGAFSNMLNHFDKDLEIVDTDERKLCGFKATDEVLILEFT